MEEEKVIRLPSKEEMLGRLLKVDADSYLREHFYPKLLNEAGTEVVAMGVVMILQLSLYDCMEELPGPLAYVTSLRTPDFIDALVTDAEVAAEAKALFNRSLNLVKGG